MHTVTVYNSCEQIRAGNYYSTQNNYTVYCNSSVVLVPNKLASLEATLVRNYDRLTDGGEA